MLLVLDASFIAKWFKEEVHTGIALKFKEEFVNGIHEIVVPDLILYELANAMRYDKSFSSVMVSQSIRSLVDLGIDIVMPTEDLISESLEIAHKYDISVYDAIYIALASKLDAVFVTADRRLFGKIAPLGFVKFIVDMR